MFFKIKSTKRESSSGVEHHLAKVGVEGSNPFFRSKKRCMSAFFFVHTVSNGQGLAYLVNMTC